MNRDDIIRMVEEASGGKPADGWGVMLDHDQLERFAALAEAHGAAAEREACAEVCDVEAQRVRDLHDRLDDGCIDALLGKELSAKRLAEAIRARGQG